MAVVLGRRPHPRGWLRGLRIGVRISLAMASGVVLAVAIVTAGALRQSERLTEQALERELAATGAALQGRLDSEADRALGLARGLAGNAQVQAAFAAGDRAALAGMLVPGFATLRDRHGVVQMQFHTPEARSFLRVHRPDRHGDDLAGFRQTVVEVNRARRPVAGLEGGVEGLGIRGVVPVAEGDRHVGSFEVGLTFGAPFFRAFRESTGAEVAFLLRRDGGFETFASTFAAPPQVHGALLEDALRGRGAMTETQLGPTHYAVRVGPIRDYAGAIIGVSIVAVDRGPLDAILAEARWRSLADGALALALALGLAWLMQRGIVGPIRRITAAMTDLARGNTAVEVPHTGRRDELGEMAGALEVFRQGMAETERLRAERAAAEARLAEEKRAAMLALADGFEEKVAGTIAMVASAATEMERTAHGLEAMARDAAARAGEASQGAGAASDAVTLVAAATEELSASSQEIARQTRQSAEMAGAAVQAAQRTDRTMAELSGVAGRISEVVGLIGAIARQTNLLALNATIEAARAGESGRGFAVVADEVRALAEQTGKATEEIGQQITAMRGATDAAVAAVQDIAGGMARIDGAVASIAGTVGQQEAATREIAGNIHRAADGANQARGSVAALDHSVAETGSAARSALDAAAETARHAEGLRRQVAHFLQTVRAA